MHRTDHHPHRVSDDALALRRLAALDSAGAPPSRPLLLAGVDGELRVALSLSDGSGIADPTAAIVTMLRAPHGSGRGA